MGFLDLLAVCVIGYFSVCAIEAWRGGDAVDSLVRSLEELQGEVDEAFDRLETLNAELLAMRARQVRKEIGIK